MHKYCHQELIKHTREHATPILSNKTVKSKQGGCIAIIIWHFRDACRSIITIMLSTSINFSTYHHVWTLPFTAHITGAKLMYGHIVI